jgi:hypothetical protein
MHHESSNDLPLQPASPLRGGGRSSAQITEIGHSYKPVCAAGAQITEIGHSYKPVCAAGVAGPSSRGG